MIKISLSPEPDCLEKLKLVSNAKYDDLKGECDDIVRNLLYNDQKKLCAYCQRELKSIKARNPEYSGVLAYKFSELINHYSSQE